MNYEKIYGNFIEHRKTLPKLDTEIYEKHHILPKTLGGSDKEDNLINLTLREHFIAHLLLAKIHGAGMWYAANMMRMKTEEHMEGGFRATSHIFAMIRANLTKLGGEHHHLAKNEKHNFINLETKEIHYASKFEISKKFGLDVRGLSRVITGCRGIYKNFSIVGNDYEKTYDYINRFIKYKIKEISTGKDLIVTRQYMQKVLKMRYQYVSSLLSGKSKQSCGYTFVEVIG